MLSRTPNNSTVQLKSKNCVDSILKPLLENVNLKINGLFTPKKLYQTVLNMAVNKNSIHSTAKRYQNTRSETTIRYHLDKLNMDELIKANNKILMSSYIKSLKAGKKYEFAIDYTNDPYYGEIDSSNKKYVIKSHSKKSTNSFYSYVSLYIINKNERFTISVLPVKKKSTKVEYLKYFIDLIKKLNFEIKVLCLDREFYSIDVFELLNSHNVPYIVPVVKKGKLIKQILNGKKSRSANYTMKNSMKQIDLNIVIDVKYMKGKRDKKGCENLGFVVSDLNWTPRKVSRVYRRRFAIESSYRMRNIVKPRTSSKNPTIRYFFALISFLLKNTWLYLQKKHFTIVKPGPQIIEEDRFRFDMFILFVEDWTRNKLKIRNLVDCLK